MKRLLTKDNLLTTAKYILCGVLGAGINYGAYLLCREIGLHYQLANASAWVLSLVYSYFSNKYLVFRHVSKTRAVALAESVAYFASRAATLLLEYWLLYLFVEVLSMPDRLGKLVTLAATGVANYLIAFFIVFACGRRKC